MVKLVIIEFLVIGAFFALLAIYAVIIAAVLS